MLPHYLHYRLLVMLLVHLLLLHKALEQRVYFPDLQDLQVV